MQQNLDVYRDILLVIENEAAPNSYFSVTASPTLNKKYSKDILIEHLLLMKDSQCFRFVDQDLSDNFFVNGLTKTAYAVLDKIRNEKEWNKIKKKMSSKGLSPTFAKLAEFLGILTGNIIKSLL